MKKAQEPVPEIRAPELGENPSCVRRFRVTIYIFVGSTLFEGFITTCIMLNTVAMACEHYEQPLIMNDISNVLNYVSNFHNYLSRTSAVTLIFCEIQHISYDISSVASRFSESQLLKLIQDYYRNSRISQRWVSYDIVQKKKYIKWN